MLQVRVLVLKECEISGCTSGGHLAQRSHRLYKNLSTPNSDSAADGHAQREAHRVKPLHCLDFSAQQGQDFNRRSRAALRAASDTSFQPIDRSSFFASVMKGPACAS